MQHRQRRQALIDTARQMNLRGLNLGTAGNLSLRLADRLLITPTGVPYDRLTPDEIVELDFAGRVIGRGTPSSEWRLHRDLLGARAEIDVVLHAHPRYATALACLRREIPAFHYMVAVAGGDSIRCAPYATFGSERLAGHALAALQDRRACLLANHGLVALGATLDEALGLALEVEQLAAQYLAALQVGDPVLLTAVEMEEVRERFASYRRAAPPTRFS